MTIENFVVFSTLLLVFDKDSLIGYRYIVQIYTAYNRFTPSSKRICLVLAISISSIFKRTKFNENERFLKFTKFGSI